MELAIVPRWGVAEFAENLSGLWAAFETIYDSFGSEQWSKPYGKDWTYADQPFHMAYFDRYIVNDPIELGLEIPEAQRSTFTSIRKLNEWNAAEFAGRPEGERPAQSRERMKAEHDRTRTLMAALTDPDLGRPAYDHFFTGDKGTVRDALTAAIVHNWGELSELRFRAKRADVSVPPTATKLASSFYVSFMGALARPEKADKPFVLGLELRGPGGGRYAIRVGEGITKVADGLPDAPDLLFKTTPDNMNIVLIRQAIHPMVAMLTGKLKVRGITKMRTMQKLFPEPALDDELPMIA